MTRTKSDISVATRRARLVIDLTAGGMVLLFGWLQYSNEAVGRALTGASPEFLLRLSLAIYFLCWAAGTRNDTNEQELAYSTGMSKGFPKGGYVSALGLALVFGLLCLVRSAQAFTILLATFIIVNVLTWRFLTRRVMPCVLDQSRRGYLQQEEGGACLILEQFEQYMCGRWQWYRFGYGAAMIAAMLSVSFWGAPSLVRWGLTRDVLLGMMVLFYVLTFEGWIWYMRIRLRLKRELVDEIEKRYTILPRGGVEARS